MYVNGSVTFNPHRPKHDKANWRNFDSKFFKSVTGYVRESIKVDDQLAQNMHKNSASKYMILYLKFELKY